MGEHAINILTYNIFCRPSYVCYDEQMKRVQRIPEALKKSIGEKKFAKLDILCFLEAFDHDVNDVLTVELHKMGFKHSTNILNSYALLKLKFINGGIRIFSRHPIIRSEYRMFPFSGIMNLESYVGKGALSVKIQKKGFVWHVVGTHLAAWAHGSGERRRQLALIDDFINDMKYAGIVESGEPVIVTGDFNIDAFTVIKNREENEKTFDDYCQKDMTDMIKCLGAYSLPRRSIRGLEDGVGSYCKKENSLVGRDGDERMEVNELLDYSLVIKDPRYKLSKYSMRILKLFKSVPELRGILYKDTGKRSRNLSDHFPNLTKICVKKKSK